ncbi:MAG: carbon starvation protein A [Bacteroidetes bacterium]|nr:carbon starvation protein A [Bacteroidota bacterium]
MSGILILFIAIVAFTIAYRTYGKFLSNKFGVDDNNSTPSHENRDNVDYIPSRRPILFGHHFASIAGVGPIVGPVLAVVFGWLPVYLWIIAGSIFIGGVHDYSSMMASLRHKGKTIGAILEIYMGLAGKRFFIFFTWSTLILVIAVFGIIIADTFVNIPSAGTSSLLFILIAVLFGLLFYKYKLPLWLSTIGGVLLLIAAVYLGQSFPLHLSKEIWMVILFVYIFIASVTPVWILLQPRDYLNSFFLYAILFGGIIGVVFANPNIQTPLFTEFSVPKLGFLFPALFVTVACGAISGFHSIVASGTTSKQLNKESDAKFIGYGGMLLEGLLAVLAMLSVATMGGKEFLDLLTSEGPVSAFSTGIANFAIHIPLLNISFEIAQSVVALGVAAFALTTLDTSTRLARYLFQEYFSSRNGESKSLLSSNRYIGTAVTLFFASILTFSGKTMNIWPVFGSANQLLAALALLAITVWLGSTKQKYLFSFIPMVFMFIVTLSALGMIFYNNIILTPNITLAVISFLLFSLAVLLAYEAYKILFKKNRSSKI